MSFSISKIFKGIPSFPKLPAPPKILSNEEQCINKIALSVYFSSTPTKFLKLAKKSGCGPFSIDAATTSFTIPKLSSYDIYFCFRTSSSYTKGLEIVLLFNSLYKHFTCLSVSNCT